MNQNADYTPVVLYARVSSDRQDVDLSVCAQLRALRDYAEKNGYLGRPRVRGRGRERAHRRPPRVPQDDRRGRQAQRSLPGNLGLEVSPASLASASTPSPSSPCSGARASGLRQLDTDATDPGGRTGGGYSEQDRLPTRK